MKSIAGVADVETTRHKWLLTSRVGSVLSVSNFQWTCSRTVIWTEQPGLWLVIAISRCSNKGSNVKRARRG